MTAFKNSLRTSKQRCSYQQQLRDNQKIIQILQNHLNNKTANKTKIEISDLCYLISKKPRKKPFKSLLQKFLESDFLKVYIEKNRRIKEQKTKTRYSSILQRVQWELQCKRPFNKFMPQKHSKNSQPQSPVRSITAEEDLNFQTDSPNIQQQI